VGAMFSVVLAGLSGVIPNLFTDDPVVQERARDVWWIFVAMLPLNGAVFALDGILIGASDTRYLAVAMAASAAVYVPAVLLAARLDWGLRGVWGALLVLMGARLMTTGARFAGRRWALVGAPA
jgi:Na+-driven multidrug efflux pump